jgi:hypothetical protein
MPERKDAAGAGTAAAAADLPTTRLRSLGSVRGPLFLPGPRRVPRHATPLMIRSQRPATNRDLTRQMILERPCQMRKAGNWSCSAASAASWSASMTFLRVISSALNVLSQRVATALS